MKIAFYANRMRIEGDYLEKRGLGGSESALINLSRAIKRVDPSVNITIYNDTNRRDITDYDGIIYKGMVHFNSECKTFNIDAFITLRDHQPFSLPYIDARKKILWSQDDMNEKGLQDLTTKPYAIENIDCFLAISEYAKGEIEKGFPGKIVHLQRNGFNKHWVINNPPQDRKPIAVYTSTPYRGLDVLAEVWPYIYNICKYNNVIPELRVFSGMELYDWSNAPFGELFKKLSEMEGVKVLGSTCQKKLYEELCQCKVMLYPNHFLETGCMSVLEALACGLRVVTTDLGALKEQVRDNYNGYLISGDAHSVDYKNEFLQKSITTLLQPSGYKSNDGLIFSWDEQAERLLKVIS